MPATLGIRHFSPASARALTHLLERLQPRCILLEAPSDAGPHLRALGAGGTRPPVGLVGLTSPTDDARFLYPLAPESAEWVAVSWAHQHGCALEGIDLPGAHQLALARALEQVPMSAAGVDPYTGFAAAAGVSDFDVWWERHFEHAPSPEMYADAIQALALGLREQRWPEGLRGEWLLREAFMRHRIREVLASGVPPEHCIVVCGAVHAPALTHDRAALPHFAAKGPKSVAPAPDMHDAAAWMDVTSAPDLRWFPVVLTSERIHSHAGARALHPPFAYLRLLAQAWSEGGSGDIAPRFLARVAELLRARGAPTGPAEVIDAVRLAEQLAALQGSGVITLQDLRDAAVTCFSTVAGSPARIAAAVDTASRGALVGHLEGARPLLAVELERRLDALGLPRLVNGVHQTLELDLRPGPDRDAREQSTLLHRLRALSLPGIRGLPPHGAGTRGGWIERWELRGVPELNEALFEAGLLGDSLEAALLARLGTRLGGIQSVRELVAVLVDARTCGLPELLDRAAERLLQLDLDAPPFSQLVDAARTLRMVVGGSGARQPRQASPEGAAHELLLVAAIRRVSRLNEISGVDAEEARALTALVTEVTTTGTGREALFSQLEALATGLQGRPRLRGHGLALALEQALVPLPKLSRLITLRLSSVDVRETASFFEGLLAHDPTALTPPLLEALDAWVEGADPIAFSRGLIPLRRLFARWSPEARRHLAAQRSAHRPTQASMPPEDGEIAPTLHPPGGPLAQALERLDDVEL